MLATLSAKQGLALAALDMESEVREVALSSGMSKELRARFDECLERDEQGRPRLTVTLPNEAALANLARSLATLLG